MSFEDRKEISRTISRLEKQVFQTEDEIHRLEKKSEELHGLLSTPENIGDHSVFDKYEKVKSKLDEMLVQWEDQNEELENWKQKKNW